MMTAVAYPMFTYIMNPETGERALCSDQNTIAVLNIVRNIMDNLISDLRNKPLTVIFDKSRGYPTCFRRRGEIYLSTTPVHWCQIIKQFAHELCHYAIPSDVIPELEWLEEMLCESASLYTLFEFREACIENGFNVMSDDGCVYYELIGSYIADDISKIEKPADGLSDIRDADSGKWQYEKLRYISVALSATLNKYRSFWDAIPALCRIENYRSFDGAMDDLMQICVNPYVKNDVMACKHAILSILRKFNFPTCFNADI